MFATRTVIFAFALAAATALGGCASSPDYVAADRPGDYGHHSRKLSGNRYRVNFTGHRRTGYEDTRDYALLRAAELTLAEGYEWFVIADRESESIRTREPEARFGYQRAYYTERRCGLLACTQSTRPATYARMEFDTARPETTHRHSLEIVMGEGEPPADGNYYDAQSVVKSIYESM